MLTLNEYQKQAISMAIYKPQDAIVYTTLGLTGEAGEVADKIKKTLRDDGGFISQDKKEEIALEIGDVLWYVQALAGELGYTLETIAEMNLTKLRARKARKMLSGSGDNR